MKRIVLITVLAFSSLIITVSTRAQGVTDSNVFGHVVNAATGEHVPYINVVIEGTRFGTITDGTGHYILTNLPVGKHTLMVVGMGYETKKVEFEIELNQSIEIDVKIDFTGIDLASIVITASPTSSGFRYQPDLAYMGEQLQKRAEVSFGELLNNSAGISMRSFGSAPARPVIRGLDGDRILILENGERMGDISETSADHSIALDPLVASRVEVVRGPASLLYGSSALGGVINIMTTDIPDRWDRGSSGILSLQGATMNKMGAGFTRYTYGSENWAVTGRIAHRQAGNITTPLGPIMGTSMTSSDASIGFGFERERVLGGISYSMADQRYEIPENSSDPHEGVEIRMQRHAFQGRLAMERDGFFDKMLIRYSASRMFQQEIEYEYDNNIRNEDVELEYLKYALSSSVTFQHKPFSFFDRGALGINLHGHRLDVDSDEAYTPGENRGSLGIFSFQEIPLSNTTRLQAGVRFDVQYTGARPNDAFPGIINDRIAFNHSSSFGFNHRPLDGLEIGAQVARSHRNPSVEELFANGAHLGAAVFEVGNDKLRDEIGQGTDFFIHYKRGIIEIEAAGFVNYFRNYIIFEPTGYTDPGSGYPIFRYRGDEARLIGGELSATLNPHKNLELGVGLDYVQGRRAGDDSDYLPFIPPLRLRSDIEYDFGIGWIGARVISSAKQNKVAPDEEPTDGYTLIGLSAGIRFTGTIRQLIILRADNLLDKEYRDHLSRIEDRNFPMPGRNITVAYRMFF